MAVNQCSIIICTYNRLAYLKKCIASLLKIDFPEYDIIIVNDGSTDGTKEFVDTLNSEKIRVVHHEQNKGLSIARNTGIAHAHSPIVAFTDDDCTVDKQWLTELTKKFTSDRIGFVIGQIFYVSKAYRGYFPERLVSNRDALWPMGANIAYRKNVFETCGDFDNFFFQFNNEDSEMAIRAIHKGVSFCRAVDAVVYHQAMNWTAKSLLRSARNAAVWPLLKKKYPHHYSSFGTPIRYGIIIHPQDYAYIILAPIIIPLILIRYLWHGKRDLKTFFTKWPVYFILRRLYIYREAIKNKTLLL